MRVRAGSQRALLVLLTLAAADRSLAGYALADEASDAFSKAQVSAQAGDTLAADAALEDARTALMDRLPLAFRRVVVVDGKASGFGIYKPRETNDFRNGETMEIYLEPIGFGYGTDGLGNNQLDLNCDVIIRDDKGAKLGDLPGIGQLKMATRAKPKDLFLNISLSFQGTIPAGAYSFDLVVTDRSTKKQANTPIKFRITS